MSERRGIDWREAPDRAAELGLHPSTRIPYPNFLIHARHGESADASLRRWQMEQIGLLGVRASRESRIALREEEMRDGRSLDRALKLLQAENCADSDEATIARVLMRRAMLLAIGNLEHLDAAKQVQVARSAAEIMDRVKGPKAVVDPKLVEQLKAIASSLGVEDDEDVVDGEFKEVENARCC